MAIDFNSSTTNLTPLVQKSTAASALASIALVVPISTQPSATTGYQPTASLGTAAASGSLTNLATSSINSLLNFTDLPPTLLFHYEGENEGTFESDITDHYVEDNTTLVDQIGLRPEIIKVTGYMGDLNDILPAALQALVDVANTLVNVDAYNPSQSITAEEQVNNAILTYEEATSVANSAVSAFGSISTALGFGGEELVQGSGVYTVGSSFTQDVQQQMFQQFYGYWNTRTLFNIQTPWAVFTGMAIKTLRAVQDESTRMITSFEVTFKKIRTAQSLISGLLSQGRALTQSSPLSDNGTSAGVPGTSLGGSIGATA